MTRQMSPKRRLEVFTAAAGICHICGGRIDGAREAWDVEHVIPLALCDRDDDANLRPAHASCHRSKTSTDITNIARAKRLHEKHTGARKPKGWGPFRKRMNGLVERWEDA
jgi:5-methylcytosine-specific restriction enzyme A